MLPRTTDLFIDFAAVCFFLAFAYGFSLVLHVDTFVSVLLYLAVPSIYLCYRRKKNYKKILIASVVLGLVAGMAYDFMAEFNHAYAVHYANDILNFRVIGKTPVGDFLWAFLIPFSIIVHYEHFLDKERVTALSKRFPIGILAGAIVFFSAVAYLVFFPTSRSWPYAFMIVGLLSAVPLFALLFERRQIVEKILLSSVFFFVLNLVFEVSALTLKQWSFPGEYIGWMYFAGVSFPAEEFFLWIIPSSAVFVLCYEVLFDDNK